MSELTRKCARRILNIPFKGEPLRDAHSMLTDGIAYVMQTRLADHRNLTDEEKLPIFIRDERYRNIRLYEHLFEDGDMSIMEHFFGALHKLENHPTPALSKIEKNALAYGKHILELLSEFIRLSADTDIHYIFHKDHRHEADTLKTLKEHALTISSQNIPKPHMDHYVRCMLEKIIHDVHAARYTTVPQLARAIEDLDMIAREWRVRLKDPPFRLP